MTSSTPRTINSLIFKPSAGTSPWAGLLIALLCGLLLPGCSKSASSSKLDAELAALESDDAAARAGAILNLNDVPGGEAAASKVIGLLKDSDVKVREAAVGFLLHHKQSTPEAVAGLAAAATGDADNNIQMIALGALAALSNEKFVELCVNYLNGDDENKQSFAASRLAGAAEGSAEGAQAALVARLKSGSNSDVRSQCTYALGTLGAKATAETKAALEEAAKDADKLVADGAKKALESLQ